MRIVPKNLTRAAPNQASLALGPILGGVVGLVRPVVVALNATAAALLRLVRVEPQDEVSDAVTHEEVGLLLAESRREGLIDHEEHTRTAEALAFVERRVTEALIPVEQLVAIGPTSTPADVEALAGRTGHSRFPRYDQEGVLSGYVHLRDVLSAPRALRDRPVPSSRIRPLAVVGPAATLVEVVEVLRAEGSHAARVDGEDGSALGVVTLDGVLLQLIPERRDPSAA